MFDADQGGAAARPRKLERNFSRMSPHMTQLLKFLPLFTLLIVAPAVAAEPDPHAGHHPEAAAVAAKPAATTAPAAKVAEPAAKPVKHACPMTDGKMMGESGAMAGKAADGKMMMDHKDMHCMPAAAPAEGADAPHDHEHPDAAPK
jgi:hypothetical protein